MSELATRTRDDLLEAAALAASRADDAIRAADGDEEIEANVYELRALRLTIHAAIAAASDDVAKQDEAFAEGWADVELMGHRQRVGYVREIRLAGKHFLEIRGLRETSVDDGTTEIVEELEIYAGAAVFSMRPIDEDQARTIAHNRFEIPF
jgi:hypothetical protein